MKLSAPFKGATPNNISQTFHEGHKALDLVANAPALGIINGYGMPLCAPEICGVEAIVGEEHTPDDTSHLERGYGIYLRGVETGLLHFYWHTFPVFPVRVNQRVRRGQIVAFMGNAGYVNVNGVYVLIEKRTEPMYPGTHQHWELREKGDRIGGVKHLLNPVEHIDWNRQPDYTIAEHIGAISIVLGKTLKLIS